MIDDPLATTEPPSAAFRGPDVESDLFAAQVMGTVLDAVVVIDEDGIVRSANPRVETLFGFTPKELVGQNVSVLMPSPHAEGHDGYLRRYLATGERHIIGIGREVTARRKDGTLFSADLAVSELIVGTRRYFTGVLRDISERKAVETALHENEQRLERQSRILRATVALQELFIARENEAQVYEQSLGALLDITGCKDGFIAETTGSVADRSGGPRVLARRGTAGALADPLKVCADVTAAGGRIVRNETSADGTVSGTLLALSLNASGEAVGVVGLADRASPFDDTLIAEIEPALLAAAQIISEARSRRERARAQQEAAQARERLVTAIESLDDAFALYDKDDRLVLCNRRYLEYHPRTAPFIVPGQRFEDIIRECVRRGEYKVAIGHEQDFIAERTAVHRRADSTVEVELADGRWLKVSERRTPDGGIVGIRADITRQKRVQAELRVAKDQAEAANAAKSEFMSSMSHELRTPMNAILGFTQLMLLDERTPLEDSHREYCEHILRSGEHLLGLINDVLDLTKIEAGNMQVKLETFDARPVVDACLNALDGLAVRRKIRLELRADTPSHIWVSADPTRLQQVLLNLLSNGIKYNREGGRVSMSVAPSGADRVRIEVTDTGTGIPPERRPDVFSPFVRLGAEAGPIEGSGIGLTITKRLVTMMRGTIDFESVPGEGTRFWVELPSADPSTRPSCAGAASSLPQGAIAEQPRLVLFVEEDPSDIALMRNALARIPSVDLIAAHTAELGLALAESRPPALVVLNADLAGVEAARTARNIRALPGLQRVPVVAVGTDTPEWDASAFDAVLRKPLHLPELEKTVRTLLPVGPRAR